MDKIIKTLICDGQVSLAVLDCKDLVNRAVEIHGLNGEEARVLGGLLVCGAYISSFLKEESGSVSLTVHAKNSDGAASVSADFFQHIRGYADGSVCHSLAGGTLTVVREDGFSQPFVGTCEIKNDDISDILETYYGISEQVATAAAIDLIFGGDGKCVMAGGVVMQLLPDASDQMIWQATDVFDQFKNREAIKKNPKMYESAQEIYDNYFAPYAGGEVSALYPEYRCNCSEEKIRRVLASVGKTELLKICEELGEVKVHCHYCNKDYIYDGKRIEDIFG